MIGNIRPYLKKVWKANTQGVCSPDVLVLHPMTVPTIDKPKNKQEIRMERIQVSHGRTIRVVSVFPINGHCPPEEKLQALIDLEIQQQKLCA